MPRICVFCGSSSGLDPAYSKATIELSEELARRGWDLVYGGSHCGLMGLVADTMLAAGREVIGVIPSSMVEREIAHTGLTELRIVATMHERKALMAELADGFVVLPGAYGTLDELCEILCWSFQHLQAEDGGSVYLRLSTRPVDQPARAMTPELSAQLLEGAYWHVPPGPRAELAIVACGMVVPEAIEAHRQLLEDLPDTGLLIVTSADRLHAGWLRAQRSRRTGSGSFIEGLLSPLSPSAGLVTVLDGHAATLSWLGAVASHRVVPLGVERFGQSGDIPDLYRAYGLDADAILAAAARLCVGNL